MKVEFTKDNFSQMTTEDLMKKKKSVSFVTGLLAGALIALFIITIFQTVNKGFTSLLFLPIVSLPILFMVYGQVRSINKELESRKSDL
ncbi:hypothetical protein GCM10023187_45010 [Nibrella viscosa]|uniref:Redox-active disulfide protein 2 n=1 Tax=Nibrella viscosa TaxID=1084524 RepID=A0ABP8KT07_9BACT